MEPLRFDTSVNIKELFPAHSRKIDALEQRFTSSPTTVVPQLQMDLEQSNNEIEEEELYSDTDEVASVKNAEPRAVKRGPRFSPEEDKKILEGYQKFGTKWEEIAKWGNLSRLSSQIRQRYYRLVKTEKAPSPDRTESKESNTVKSSKESVVRNDEPPAKQRRLNADSLEEQAKLDQELRIQAAKERLAEMEIALHAREEQLKAREERVRMREEQLKKEGPKENTAEVVRNILITSMKFERELVRKKLAEDKVRLGYTVSERRGVDHHEVWQDGEFFRELDAKEKHLAEQRDQLEQLKKQHARLKKTEDSAEEMAEIMKVRQGYLKKVEGEYAQERERLNNLKYIHMKELKRVADEDGSNFNSYPLLDQRYLLLSLLGKGGFSEVYRAFDLLELRNVACKIHCVNPHWSASKRDNYVKHALREFHIQQKLSHPKVVKLFDVLEIDNNSFCTVLEYCEGGDLDGYLKSQKMLSEKEARCIMKQIFAGLKYLNEQKQPVIHYDLKPGNILFSNGEVKITDFGLSKIMDEDADSLELTSQGAGTYWYLPPECFEMGKRPPQISSKVDVWSAGVILYQLLYGKRPFGNELSQQRILSDNVILNAKLDFPAKPVVDSAAKDFISKCLTFSQDRRPDVFACCNDNFIRSVNYKKASSSTTTIATTMTTSTINNPLLIMPPPRPGPLASLPTPTSSRGSKRKSSASHEPPPDHHHDFTGSE